MKRTAIKTARSPKRTWLDSGRTQACSTGSGPERGPILKSVSPIDGKVLASVRTATADDYERAVQRRRRRSRIGAPFQRPGAGDHPAIRKRLARRPNPSSRDLVTLEAGKILAEGGGEVQEMIRYLRFCHRPLAAALRIDNRLGTARPPHDGAMASAWCCRHHIGLQFFQWRSGLGTAPWRSSAAMRRCGKPSEQTPLCAIATIKSPSAFAAENGVNPAIFSMAIGGRDAVGERMAQDGRLAADFPPQARLTWGRDVGEKVQRRLGPRLARIGRQQRDHRRRLRESGLGDAGDIVRGGRHRRAALHEHTSRLCASLA